ncbi:MAG: hypothetical protein FJY95_03195 [Candidatus Handelsmanbacteria bacterium]|nr:hypothetical protein [Candidatus Handelsmanbacteria bacterium]
MRKQAGELDSASRCLAIEAAAARVRYEVLSMRVGDDLLRVVAVMFRELLHTGTQRSWCNIMLIDEEGDRVIH